MKTKKHLQFIVKNFLSWVLIILWWISAIYWVIAFESWLSTIPSESWFKSGGSQILSIASGWGFDRTTDSLEALSNKISANETKIDTVDTKVDWISWGWVSWAGYTAAYQWYAIWWTKWFATKCNTAYSWSKPMSYQDWIDLWTEYPSTQNARLIDWSYSSYYSSNPYQFSKDWNDIDVSSWQYPMCGWWSGDYRWPYIHASNWDIYISGCTSSLRLPCVYK